MLKTENNQQNVYVYFVIYCCGLFKYTVLHITTSDILSNKIIFYLNIIGMIEF